jgi:hypothetical protein
MTDPHWRERQPLPPLEPEPRNNPITGIALCVLVTAVGWALGWLLWRML